MLASQGGHNSVAIGVGSQIIAGETSASAHKQIYAPKQNQYRMFNPAVQLNHQQFRSQENQESKSVYQDPTKQPFSLKESNQRYVANERNRS